MQEQGGIPNPMALAKAIYAEEGIPSSRKSFHSAAVCVSVSIIVSEPTALMIFAAHKDVETAWLRVSFFLSVVCKTQANHWTKRMVNT